MASHNRVQPPLHGISVCPSGLLPFDLVRLDDSLIAGISALLRLRCSRSLMLLCLACRPNPKEHVSPCAPLADTLAPHPHRRGSQMATPNRRLTATLTVSSSNLRARAAIGSAYKKSEACGNCEAFTLAWL